jgi:hypothetical protein
MRVEPEEEGTEEWKSFHPWQIPAAEQSEGKGKCGNSNGAIGRFGFAEDEVSGRNEPAEDSSENSFGNYQVEGEEKREEYDEHRCFMPRELDGWRP